MPPPPTSQKKPKNTQYSKVQPKNNDPPPPPLLSSLSPFPRALVFLFLRNLPPNPTGYTNVGAKEGRSLRRLCCEKPQ